MRIILEPTTDQTNEAHPYPRAEVSVPHDALSLSETFDSLIIPALLAIGFQRGSIDDYLNGE